MPKTNIVILVIIAKDWEQPKGLSNEDKLNKIWCMYTMEYYTTINRDEKYFHRLLRFDIQDILLNENPKMDNCTVCYDVLEKHLQYENI